MDIEAIRARDEQDIPDLLARVAELRADRDQWRHACYDMRDQRDRAWAIHKADEANLTAEEAKRQELEASLAAAKSELDAFNEWSNTVADRIPEDYDGDDSQEAIIDRWLDDQAAALAAANAVIDAARRVVAIWTDNNPDSPSSLWQSDQDEWNDSHDDLVDAVALLPTEAKGAGS